MSTLERTIDRAFELHRADHPKATYGLRCIGGTASWSGSDLKGRAKQFGGTYYYARKEAERILKLAGGVVLKVKHGHLETAAPVGQDDFGVALFETSDGVVRPEGGLHCRRRYGYEWSVTVEA